MIDAAEIEIKAVSKILDWKKDWNLFAKEALGANLDKQQKEILQSCQHKSRTSVVSGTARGKDYVAAVVALCFLYLTPQWNEDGILVDNTKVALSAPTDRQVKNIMMPEISRLWNAAKRMGVDLPGRLNAYDIRTNNEEWFLTGFKADEHNHEAWSGFHAVNTMFCITEASGISDDTFNAIEGNLQGNSRLLIVFNPNNSIGYAARSQKSSRFQKFRLSSLDAPNVLQKKTVIPGQVDYTWIKDKVEHWCTNISVNEVKTEFDDFQFEGNWYRPDDVFRIKVLGKFPKVSEDALIPQIWFEAAQERWRNYNGEGANNTELMLGIDVAGMGRDSTVECYRYGNYVEKFLKFQSSGDGDYMNIVGRVKTILHLKHNSKALIDTIGEGAGVYFRLIEQGYEDKAISCKYSESASNEQGEPLTDITGQYQFANMRAYLFWMVREFLDPKTNPLSMLPPGTSLLEEATEIKWKFHSNGKIIIEPKEDIKKRIGRSTDEFDALANTFYPNAYSVKDLTGVFY